MANDAPKKDASVLMSDTPKLWPGQDTLAPADLVRHYQKDRFWERARYFYETWRKTTALIDPPGPWESLDTRMQLAICAVASVMVEEAKDDAHEDWNRSLRD